MIHDMAIPPTPYPPRRWIAYAIDPVAWATNELNFNPDPWQQEVLRSDGDLCLVCSRQSGKSTTTAVLAAHQAVFFENSTTLVVSPGQRQSTELFRKAAAFVKTALGSVRLPEDNRLSLTTPHGARIISVPASDASIRGFSVDLLIADEASRIADDIFAAVRPMTAATKGRTALLSTPFGKQGFFASVALGDDNDWRRWLIAADQCPRISLEFLQQERVLLGQKMFAQEYQCEFNEADDAAFGFDEISDAFGALIKGPGSYGVHDDDAVAHVEPAFAN